MIPARSALQLYCTLCVLLVHVYSDNIVEEDDYAHFTYNFGPFLFDLETDPTEDTNLYYDSGEKAVDIAKAKLTMLRKVYSDSVADPQIPSETGTY